MGFSVSGSAAIIFAGMFLAFGMWHTAASNGFERVSEAQQDRTDGLLAQQNTAIEIQTAAYAERQHNEQTWYLADVTVTNNGTTTLDLERTDVLVDNDYRAYDRWATDATVDGTDDTHLWAPGETLTIGFNESSEPDRVQVATEHGVSDSSWVSQA